MSSFLRLRTGQTVTRQLPTNTSLVTSRLIIAPRKCCFSTHSTNTNTTATNTTAPSRPSAPLSASVTPTPPPIIHPFIFMTAPLEDVSESSFRRLTFDKGGSDLTFTEMSRIENLARKATSRSGSSWWKTEHALARTPPSVVQILCNNEESLRQFLAAFQPTPGSFAGFNLNLGCPSPDILSLGLGAQAIKRIAKTHRYVEQLNEWLVQHCSGPEWTIKVGTRKPNDKPTLLIKPTVSIKLRLGANEREKKLGSHINLIKSLIGNTSASESSPSSSTQSSSSSSGPISYFILHGRHGKQHYEAVNDFTAIAHTIQVTGARNIIANGDIHTGDQVVQCLDMGAAGVMIGRAAVKEPGIFNRLKRELLKERPTETVLVNPPTPELPADKFREIYLSYAKEYHTLDKYIQNVSGRIGQPFIPNPTIQLHQRYKVELQGRKHPDYDTVVARDRMYKQKYHAKPYASVKVNLNESFEQQLQDSVQG